ncbi:MAG TPA: M28 family peptidase [Chthoniobacterales bacterium]
MSRQFSMGLVRIVLCCGMGLAGCKRQSAGGKTGDQNHETPVVSSQASPSASLVPYVTGAVALQHARAICNFGSRGFSGPGRQKTRQYLIEQMSQAGWDLTAQPFQTLTPAGPRDFLNLIGRFKRVDGSVARTPAKFVFVAHYDAPESKLVEFPAASDGAAGCGALLELASILSKQPEFAEQVSLVFCDGEAPVQQNTGFDGLNGSRFFARVLKENDQIRNLRGVIVLGAIGHKGAVWTLPSMTSEVVNQWIETAASYQNWVGQTTRFGRPAWGGHLPFLEAGATAAALMDANFITGDTADDSAQHLDQEPLKRAVIALLVVAEK